MSEEARNSLENLCLFITKNKNLIHLDISNAGLTERQITFFGKVLRRAKQICSLHLSGNLGITERVKDFLCERAHCINSELRNNIDL